MDNKRKRNAIQDTIVVDFFNNYLIKHIFKSKQKQQQPFKYIDIDVWFIKMQKLNAEFHKYSRNYHNKRECYLSGDIDKEMQQIAKQNIIYREYIEKINNNCENNNSADYYFDDINECYNYNDIRDINDKCILKISKKMKTTYYEDTFEIKEICSIITNDLKIDNTNTTPTKTNTKINNNLIKFNEEKYNETILKLFNIKLD